MTVTVLNPNEIESLVGANTVVPGPNSEAPVRASDGLDSSYILPVRGTIGVSIQNTQLGFETKVLAAGEIVKSLRARARHSHGYCGIGIHEQRLGTQLLVAEFPDMGTTIVDVATSYVPINSIASVTDLAVSVFSDTPSLGLRVYELAVDLVTVAQPVATIDPVTPDPYTASTIVPVSWSVTLDSDGGTDTRYRAYVTDDDDGDAVVFDTGDTLSAAQSVDVGPLTNGNYTVHVRTGQTVNGAAHWSEYATASFAVNAVTSDIEFPVLAVSDNGAGKITVTVTRSAASQAWELIEVERLNDDGESDWVPVRGATLVDATGDANTFVIEDYEAPNGRVVNYRARATYYSSGLPITGDWSLSAFAFWESDDEWLKVSADPSLNVKTKGVTYSPEQRSKRAGVFSVINAEYPVVVSDVLIAPTGSITFRTQGETELRALLVALRANGPHLLNLKPDSMTGPQLDGFQYVSILSTSVAWQVQHYLTSNEPRLITVPFAAVERPPDLSAGAL